MARTNGPTRFVKLGTFLRGDSLYLDRQIYSNTVFQFLIESEYWLLKIDNLILVAATVDELLRPLTRAF